MQFFPEGAAGQERRFEFSHLYSSMQNGDILYARAFLFDVERCLHFHLGCCDGKMPFEECALGADIGEVRDIAVITRVGRMTAFIVKDIVVDSNGTARAILSRAAAQRRCREEYFDALLPGMILPCCVTSMESFGAFCDIGCGLIALLPIDYLSVSRICTPHNRLTLGQNIFCAVRKRDEQNRLVLSMKELLGTWKENIANFTAGETVIGYVRGVESYGIFVELTPNLAGLAEVRNDVSVGDCVSVYIKSILPEKMKIKLVILDHWDAPAARPPLKFFLQEGRLSQWEYASAESGRQMTTVFEE